MSSTSKARSGSASGSRKNPSTEQVRRWLSSGFTGCSFARSFAGGKQLAQVGFEEHATPGELDTIFDAAAQGHLPAIVVFTGIRDETALLEQLRVLTTGARWSVQRTSARGLETSDLLLEVSWRTAAGLTSTPMGFGPFPTMPVTRRAPYVCLGVWPGGHENQHPHRGPPSPTAVDFLDAPLPTSLTRPAFDKAWDASVDQTTALLGELKDQSRFYRTVTFRLSPGAGRAFDAVGEQAPGA